jgi:hypothetical protein
VNWSALEQAGIEQDASITLDLSNVPASTVLSLILKEASIGATEPIAYAITDGVVTISTQKNLAK